MLPDLKEEGEFRYVEAGTGHVLILLHGLFGALSNFEVAFRHLAGKYHVVVPMLPLYSMPMLNTNVGALAKFLQRFIRHKGWKEVNLLGNSLGGHVALIHCSKHPESVRSLILTGSSGLYENAFGGGFPRREDYNYIREKVALTFFDPKHATKALVDECYETVNDKSKLIRILALAKSAIRHNMAKELPQFRMPTLLVWGRQDTITPPEVAEEFHQLLPNSALHWIDECGHAPMMEQPERFNAIVDPWLESTLKPQEA
ncbi:MAG: alpha/beta hydrolase [Flavobacteriales bacterium]|nr:alpha/beta hydrolase [Flavobacteriales bacterium]MCB9193020.1 alpha/beta hydrolase [Flavobacteriales bacterium]